MNGICLIWSRGRLFSPSLPIGDDRYLNLSSQKRPTGRNLGGNRLVRRFGTTSRGTVVLVFNLRMRSVPGTLFPRRVDHIHRIYSYEVLWHMHKTFSLLTSICWRCCCLENPTTQDYKVVKMWTRKNWTRSCLPCPSPDILKSAHPPKPVGSESAVLFTFYWFTLCPNSPTPTIAIASLTSQL